jgi:broad specificity phosphatase PhoE
MTERATAHASLLASGAALGALLTLLALQYQKTHQRHSNDDDTDLQKQSYCLDDAKHKRERLPPMIILVRHGESEGNADHTLYRTKPDNLVELTKQGALQASEAGKRIEAIFNKADQHSGFIQPAIKRVHLVISPFERTLQTAAAMRPWFEHRIVRTDVQPRIREQEFGNLQGHAFDSFREEQKKVGRFWYRFVTGESGADVYDRVKSWWHDSVLNVNERYGYEPVDALVVVTHGLTMRFVLMQLYGWSPTTFHSVWNAGNCDLYVLQKDLGKPGLSPYELDDESGDMPKSSIDVLVEFHSQPGKHKLKLADYLRIPPPRTTRLDLVKERLADQYPEIDKDDIGNVMFMPFVDGAVTQGRSTSGKRSMLKELKHTANETAAGFPYFAEVHDESWRGPRRAPASVIAESEDA